MLIPATTPIEALVQHPNPLSPICNCRESWLLNHKDTKAQDQTPDKASTDSTYMGGCQNYGPFLGPYHNTAPTRPII